VAFILDCSVTIAWIFEDEKTAWRYDAAYLGLAMRSRLPLATVDVRLADAARAERVSIFDPEHLI
jgi:predicted nucleic acid-binding protein